MTTLPVFFEQRRVGTIDVDKSGPTFTYHTDWIDLRGAFQISVTMPLKSDRIHPDQFLSWAANLLPESEHLRTVGQILGMSRTDIVGLLSAIGGDTAGALSFGQPGRTGSVQWRSLRGPGELERVIEELPAKPFCVGDEGVSMSLAGVQTKLAVAVDNSGDICIPMNGSPLTHILKPDAPSFPGSVQNEAFCLTLAKRVGVQAPNLICGRTSDRSYLLVERYDRINAGGRWRRLHQEDFCQALSVAPSAKYESNQTGVPGPTLSNMFEVTRGHMPATEILRLLDMVIFNVIVCNTDAHAKNYSIMIRGNGASIAPLYDVLCAEVWGNVTTKLAHKIGGSRDGDLLNGSHWRTCAEECGLNPKQVTSRIAALARLILQESSEAQALVAQMPAGDDLILDRVREAVDNRARRLLAQLGDGDATAVPTMPHDRTDSFATSTPVRARVMGNY